MNNKSEQELEHVLKELKDGGVDDAMIVGDNVCMAIDYKYGMIHFIVNPNVCWDTDDYRAYLTTVFDHKSFQDNKDKPLVSYLTIDEIVKLYTSRKEAIE